MASGEEEYNLLPHHHQQELCTTRLPYRQGRKLTAVKVYTINNESKHLLIFGIPSLNLRQETKALFMKFGKLLQFNITKYPSEQFTETYHALYESIQSARLAKKMLDTKNYYGGNIHICYAPELETIEETREKLSLRKIQVTSRLKNLEREAKISKQELDNKIVESLNSNAVKDDIQDKPLKKMYMGSTNEILLNKRIVKKSNKKIKLNNNSGNLDSNIKVKDIGPNIESRNTESSLTDVAGTSTIDSEENTPILDFTSPNVEVISNINEALNYNSFGKEIIKKVPHKPVNRIKFNINKKNIIYFVLLIALLEYVKGLLFYNII